MTLAHPRALAALWTLLAIGLVALAAGFTLFSVRFGYDTAVRDMPVFWLAGGLMAAGLPLLALPWLIARTEARALHLAAPLFWLVVWAGVAARLILFASEPALEDDYQRYLWDGAATAHGLNPYAGSPAAAQPADPLIDPRGRLAVESGAVIGRVNHPELRTLYPPVAQAAFALAHRIEPFSLTAWRALILCCDLAALALLVALLRAVGRGPLWASLYWWNPVVLKELFNSAHMEALLVPLVLAGLLLAARGRPVAATSALVLAAGAKLWPVLLLPLVWRPLLAAPWRLAGAVTLAGAGLALMAAPMVMAGLDGTSGLVAYATQWDTNSALFPALERGLSTLAEAASVSWPAPGILARGLVGLALGAIALWVARRPFTDTEDLVTRALLVTGALFLLSPAQFPWYYLWVLPLLVLVPVTGLLLATATLPLYYTAFHYLARDAIDVFNDTLVWAVWLPVWGTLLLQALLTWRQRPDRTPGAVPAAAGAGDGQ